jgi:hypothetical protein
MAIEDINFNQATQQGLNATAELEKIANTVRKTGAFIQNEFEMQEASDLIVEIRNKGEEIFKNSNNSQNEFDSKYNDYMAEVLQNTRNGRVRKIVNQEFEDRRFVFNGRLTEANEKLTKEKETVDVAKFVDSQTKLAQEAYLSGDIAKAEELFAVANGRIINSSILGEADKYQYTEKTKSMFENAKIGGIQQHLSQQFDKNFDLNNTTYSDIKGKTVDDIISSKIDIVEGLKKFGYNYDEKNGFFKNANGDIITNEQTKSLYNGFRSEVQQVINRKEAEFAENKAKSDQNISFAIKTAASGGTITEQQETMLIQQAELSNDAEGIRLARSLPQFRQITSMPNIQEAMVFAAKSQPKDLIMQSALISTYSVAKNTEIKTPTNYYQSNGLSKTKIDFTNDNLFATSFQNRKNEINTIGKSRGINTNRAYLLTDQEAMNMNEMFKSKSPTERTKFVYSFLQKNGQLDAVALFSQLSQLEPKVYNNIADYIDLAGNNKSEESLKIVSNFMNYEGFGATINRDGFNNDYKKSSSLYIMERMQRIPQPSPERFNAAIEKINNQFFGRLYVEKNMTENKERSALNDEEKNMIDNLINEQYGQVVEEKDGLIFGSIETPFISLTGELKQISLDNYERLEDKTDSFFKAVNAPADNGKATKITIDYIKNNKDDFVFIPVKDLDRKTGEIKTYHIVKNRISGATIAGDDERPYMLDFSNQENIFSKTKKQLAKEAGYGSYIDRLTNNIDIEQVYNKNEIEIKNIEKIPADKRTDEMKTLLKTLTENRLHIKEEMVREKAKKDREMSFGGKVGVSVKQAAIDTGQNSFDFIDFITSIPEVATTLITGEKQTEKDAIQEKNTKTIEEIQKKEK